MGYTNIMSRNNFFNSIIRDREYARRVVPYLDNGQITKDLPISIVSRCHICGDSKTNKSKRRLGIYETTDNSIHVHCFKCGYTSQFSYYLKQYWSELYSQYLFDVFEEKGIKRYNNSKPSVEIEDCKITCNNINDKLKEYIPLDELPDTHPIFRYVRHRQIPKEYYSKIGFTRRWKELSNEVCPGTFDYIYKDHPRLVIPSYDKRGVLKTINGRAFSSDEMRYQIIKSKPNVNKVFGEERVNINKSIINVVEGPIDSFFVDNSVALSGAMIDLKTFDYPKSRRVFILDNEPRHNDTISRMSKFIKAGERVVLWDKLPERYKSCKDINDMILSGWNREEVNMYIQNNITSGLNAQLRFDAWRKK